MGCIASKPAEVTKAVEAAAPAPIIPQKGHKHSSSSSIAVVAQAQSGFKMTPEVAKKWLVRFGAKPVNPKARVVCLGWAGSSSTAFKTWDVPGCEVLAVELPARNGRFSEKAITDVNLAGKRLAQALEVSGYIKGDVPLYFFAHSFGCMIALHATRFLQKDYNFVPKALFFSGCRPLHSWTWPMNYYRESDDEMLEEMVKCGGMTKEMAANRAAVAPVLPAIKGDHLAMDKYNFDPNAAKVEVPIYAMGGLEDPRCPPNLLPEWDRYTTKPIQVKTFPGAHFYLKELEKDVIAFVNGEIDSINNAATPQP